MKLQIFVVALLLSLGFAKSPFEAEGVFRNVTESDHKVERKLTYLARGHPRDIKTRDGRDCGTFIFYCGYKSTADACNNACYDIWCRNGDTIFRRGARRNKNSINSGCKARGGSPCRNNLFAQRFSYAQTPEEGGLTEPSCDEWPPAAVMQPSYSEPGRKSNSLRCMEKDANGEAGSQLGAFFANTTHPSGEQTMRTCEGVMEEGDSFKVEFNLDNASARKTYYCPQAGITHNCAYDDSFQFHMTFRSGSKGQISDPYAYGTDNQYALAGKNNIKQCVIRMTRKKTDDKVSYLFAVSLQNDDGSGTGEPLAEKQEVPDGNTIILGTMDTGLDEDLKLHPNGDGLDTNALFHYSNLDWSLSSVTNLGDKKTAKWCNKESGDADSNSYLCTFPCTNGNGN